MMKRFTQSFTTCLALVAAWLCSSAAYAQGTNNGGQPADSGEVAESILIQGTHDLPIAWFMGAVSKIHGYKFIIGSEQQSLINDPANNSVTVIAEGGLNIPLTAFFSVLQTMLKQKKMILVPSGENTATSIEFYEVVPIAEAMQSARAQDVIELEDWSRFQNDGAGLVTLIAKLRNTDANQLRAALINISTRGPSTVNPIGRDHVMIADYAANVRRMAKIIELLDRPEAAPILEVINVKNMDASELEASLQELLTQRNSFFSADGGPAGNQRTDKERVEVTLSPNQNSLIVQGHEEGLSLVRKLVAQLDVRIPGIENTQGRIHAYKVRNVAASDLAATLNALLSQGINLGSRGVPLIRPGEEPVPPVPAGTQSFTDSPPVIEFDQNTNQLIIIARPNDFAEIARIIELLDRRRPQVMIEAAILEVSSNNEFTYGAEIATIDNAGDGLRLNAGTSFGFSEIVDSSGAPVGTAGGEPVGRTPVLGSGGTFVLTQGGAFRIPLILRFLQTQSDVNVLSVPRIMGNDNEESTIEITTEVPFSVTDVLNTNQSATSFDFAEDGIVLTVTPQISEDDYVTLIIDLRVDQFSGAPPAPGAPPPRTGREIRTTVTVPNEQTIVIGGLVSNTSSRAVTKMPFLGDIPILGELFKTETNRATKADLYIFVRPQVFRDRNFTDLAQNSAEDLRRARKATKESPATQEFFAKAQKANEKAQQTREPGSAPRAVGFDDLPTKD